MSCPRCGSPGLHACIGFHPLSPTPEDEAALQNAIERLKTLRKESIVQGTQTPNDKWDNRTLGASEADVAVVKHDTPEGQAVDATIAAAGLTHVVLDPAPAAEQAPEEEVDFLSGKKACSINDPECESCQ